MTSRSPSPEDLECVLLDDVDGLTPVDDTTEGQPLSTVEICGVESEDNSGPSVGNLPAPSEPFAFTTSQLPSSNEAKNSKPLVEKNAQISRKRERSPSPPQTPAGTPPPAKKVAVNSSTENVHKAGTNNSMPISKVVSSDSKTPSPVPGLVSGRLSKPELSSASKLLNEEIQKQQALDNDRLKDLIIKEVRKPGKSMLNLEVLGYGSSPLVNYVSHV